MTAQFRAAKAATPARRLWTFQADLGARRFCAANRFTEDRLTDGQGNDEQLPDVRLVWNGALP